jgi:hypothetical protein
MFHEMTYYVMMLEMLRLKLQYQYIEANKL